VSFAVGETEPNEK